MREVSGVPVTLRNILNLSSLREMKLIAGRDGLDRVITWPFIGQNDCISDCAFGGELLFIAGAGFSSDSGTLKSLISEGCLNNLAGIVFSAPNNFLQANDFMKAIDKSVIDFADSLTFPVFLIPWGARLDEITKDMSNFIVERQNEDKALRIIMEKILVSSPDENEGLKKRIVRLGYNGSCAYQAAVMKIIRPQSTLLDDARYREYVHLFARNLLNQRCRGVMTMSRRDDIVIFAPVCHNKNISEDLMCVRDAVIMHFTGTNVTIGAGSPTSSLNCLRRSLTEAENALKIHSGFNVVNAWNKPGSGMFRLFSETFDYNEIETFCDQNIGKLVDYDKLNDTELVRTIEVYFENRFNLSRTAKILAIHRNSLMYRLNRIEEIIGRKLDDPYVILEIVNSILMKKMISSATRATG